MKHILVTGADGFVGRHVVALLHEQGYSVRAALRQTDRAKTIWSDLDRVTAVKMDTLGPDFHAEPLVEGVEVVVHLAARAHQIPDLAPDPLAAFRVVNVEGTRRLATAAQAAGVQHFVFVSSIGAMASRSARPLQAQDACCPDTPYGVSKMEAEQVLWETFAGSGTVLSVVRPPLVYGPGNPGNMGRLEALVRRGLPLPLGALRNRRSFVYVLNLCSAIGAMIGLGTAARGTFLVADGQDLSTPELIEQIAQARGKPAHLVAVPFFVLRAGGVVLDLLARVTGKAMPFGQDALDKLSSSLTLDINPTKEALDWEPPYSTKEGLRATFALETRGPLSSS